MSEIFGPGSLNDPNVAGSGSSGGRVDVNFSCRIVDWIASMAAVPVATSVRSAVHGSRDRFWKPADFSGAPLPVAKALSRLEKAGELRRIRRGLYWRGVVTPL
ncbi:MAG: type IV toxin-antitoxin system AbiEi family antitoxin domain-containing protein, partial [Actinomycetota bacterium]|nr:type IV toxin-antitoxin system AbiEi family antitoxin domain-containing protein [Actinomycetota bacterium]